jgi:hypothetical protein
LRILPDNPIASNPPASRIEKPDADFDRFPDDPSSGMGVLRIGNV